LRHEVLNILYKWLFLWAKFLRVNSPEQTIFAFLDEPKNFQFLATSIVTIS